MVARLPADKLQKCYDLITNFLRRKKVILNKLQSLCGPLNFECPVVRPARAFFRRLPEYRCSSRESHARLLTQQVKEQVAGLFFHSKYNGQCFFQADTWHSSLKLLLGHLGLGAILGRKWCDGLWPANRLGSNLYLVTS